jgi:hypothetical protein
MLGKIVPKPIPCALIGLSLLTACTQEQTPRAPEPKRLTVEQTSQLIKPSMPRGEFEAFWATDIFAALDAFNADKSVENVCAIVAVIQQESGFKADPAVANIRQILAKKIENMQENPVLSIALNLRLAQTAQNGKTFKANMQSIKTEREFEQWYNEFAAAKYSFLGLKAMRMDVAQIVTTAGSMQVSIDYAQSMASQLGQSSSNVREQVYSRAGGVLYGASHLLNYPAAYSSPYYRFADFNAGHYASRNAAFQQMILNLTANKSIGTDGDLLSYVDGAPKASKTHQALTALAVKQKSTLNDVQILADLKREKDADFTQTQTYQWLSQLHQKRFGKVLTEQIPSIVLKSDKITRKLTTQWYADSVLKRFKSCVARAN